MSGTVVSEMTGGGPLDGQRLKLPADLTTYWVGSVQSAWVTELDPAPENVVGTDLKCYRLARVREDGTHVFEWVTPSAAR